jgi:diguanylate cyclase (GGDEF)-like protein/putative nucleotidyltransferase with HDIG domain
MASWRNVRFLIVLVAGLGIASPSARGLDPAKALTQYAHGSWHEADGLPQDNVVSIAQTPDGYLWLGTEEGLARFDGLRFKVFDKSNTPELKSNDVYALLADRMGNLWIGTGGGGVLRMSQGKFVAFTTQDGLSNNSVLSLREDRDHAIWIGTEGGGVNRFKDGKFTVYNSKGGLADDSVYSIWAAKDGSVWFGTGGGLSQLKDGSFQNFTDQQGLPNKNVRALFEDRDGTLWVGTNGGGLSQFHDGHFKTFTTKDGLSSNDVFSVFQDKEGSVWIGTVGGGLNRWSNGKFTPYKTAPDNARQDVWAFLQDREGTLWIGSGDGLSQLRDGQATTYSSVEGLSSDIVLPIYEDREGSIWMGTAGGGLNRFRNGQFTSYTAKQGLADSFVLSLSQDKAGALWVATRRGLDRMKDGKFKVYTTKDGLPNNIVLCMWPDRNGDLWLGTRHGLGRFQDGKFTTYTTQDGLSNNYVTFIYQDHDGTLWVGTGGGGLNRYKDGTFTALTSKEGLSSDMVTAIHEGENGALWVGTSGGGLNRFSGGKFTGITMKDGLSDDKIFQILEDRKHNFWMSSNRGIFRVSEQQLNDFADGKITSIQSVPYGVSEGMKNRECNGGFQPAGWAARDGRVWFPTMTGAVVIDPANTSAAGLRPQVRVEGVVVDRQAFAPGEAIRITHGEGKVEFHYTGISLSAAKRVNFKYKLEGFDNEWVEAGSRRAAYYTNLPPGHYRFRVMAAGDDGKWNEAAAPCALYLAPHFYQTVWFCGLCVVLGLGLLAGARLKEAKKHAEEIAALHLRTIEALALAIEAKDETTHDHLQRVPLMALTVAKELGLSKAEMDALHAAALLHDIGKLAVPEHIITKPGRLTPEEFERMKVHPLVGAEILERVQFPYNVVPIVRSHHEKWDGSGYPDGLKGEDIPLGARILAAVDCLDAMTSDRQYRPAIPFPEAMVMVQGEAGKSFDQRVVEVLSRVQLNPDQGVSLPPVVAERRLSNKTRVIRGEAPGAGFQKTRAENSLEEPADFLHAIASAREEGQMLFELSQALGNSLSLDETLSVLAVRLKRLIPHDSISVFIAKDGYLVPEYVFGENFRELASLRIPVGEGLCGWVAENRKPIVNGNPSVEPDFLKGMDLSPLLRSTLAVPLEGVDHTVGVLGLYRRQPDAFTGDHLRILLAISAKLGFSIENALKYRIAENSATTDYLTGLPNARSLFLHLDGELARCKRLQAPLAVVVCDLDGFKQVNDRFGHLVGNRVLHSVASGLKETCREYDYVARMGGDEFVIIMPGFDTAAIKEKSLLFQSIAMEVGVQECKEPLLSLSAGVAVYPNDGLDAEQLLAEADQRMYVNKQCHHAQMIPSIGPLAVNVRPPAAIN